MFSHLQTAFDTNCWIPLSKAVVAVLRTGDKTVPNLQAYFNAKKYNSTFKPESPVDEKGRYDTLMSQLCLLVLSHRSEYDMFTTNFEKYISELENVMQSDSIFELLQSGFSKGSFKSLIDDFNRILLPKSLDDESDDPLESVKNYVKPYSSNFIDMVDVLNKSGTHLFLSMYETDLEDDFSGPMNDMLSCNSPVFSIYTSFTTGEKYCLTSLWLSCDNIPFAKEIGFDDFVTTLQNNLFQLNPCHLTNLDTLKRNYVNKDFDSFKKNTNLIIDCLQTPLHFVKATYKFGSDFDKYDELQYTNATQSFPNGFEDYTKYAFVLFFFTKDVTSGSVVVTTYWLTTKNIVDLLPKSDFDSFEFIDSNIDEFLNATSKYDLSTTGNSILGLLH